MTNEEWRQAYRHGYRDGRDDAKKEMNYTNYPPVYYGGATPNGPIPRGSAVMGTPTGGLSVAINKPDPDHKMDPFVTGMTAEYKGC